MALPDREPLPPAQDIALNYAPPAARDATATLLSFDRRLADLVSKANEPLLGQMRLAWWRDQLRLPAGDRTRGDPILEAIGEHWQGEDEALLYLVDGWEQLLAEPPLPVRKLVDFAAGRGAAFAGLARLLSKPQAQDRARSAAEFWALVDLAAGVSREDECETALERARTMGSPSRALPRALRPLAVLRGLARRTLARGGGPLIAGRGDVLVALRLGMFGR